MNLLNNFHPSIQDRDMGSDGANIIVHNLFQKIENVANKHEAQSEAWDTDVLSALRLCEGVKRASTSAQAYVLAIIREHWDDMSIVFRKRYDYQYDVLVLREAGIQPSTMDNYSRAAKIFYMDKKRPNAPVLVTVYDKNNQPIKKDGVVQKQLADFDPTNVDITKLSLAAPLARQDKLTSDQWAMLADREVTVEAFKKAIYTPKTDDDGNDPDPSLRFTLEGPRLVAHEFGEHVEIAELYVEMFEHELGRTAIRRLLMSLQIPYEQDVIARMAKAVRDQQIIRFYANNLVIPDGE